MPFSSSSDNVIIFMDVQIASNLLSRMYHSSKRVEIYRQIILEFYRNNMQVPLSDILKNDRQFILKALRQFKDPFRCLMDFTIGEDGIEKWDRNDEKFIMEMIKANPNVLMKLPKRPKYIMEALKYDPKLLEYAPKEMKGSETIVWELFKRDASCLRFASQKLTCGPFGLRVLEYDENAFKSYCVHPFNVNSFKNRDDLLRIVSVGSYFNKLNSTLKEDEEFKLAALKQDAYVWELLRSDLQNDKNFTLEWIRKNKSILGYSKFIRDYDFMVELIKEDSDYFWSFNSEMKEQLFRNDKKLLMKVLEDYNGFNNYKIPIHSTYWYSLPPSIYQDGEVVKILLRKLCKDQAGYKNFTFNISGGSITIHCDNYFKVQVDNFQTDLDFLYLNLSQIGLGMVYSNVDESLKRDAHFIAFVFNSDRNNKTVFKYDKQLVREIIPLLKQHPTQLFNDIKPLISNDRELLLFCIKNMHECFCDASDKLKRDPTFIEECLQVNISVLCYVDLKYVKMNKELAIIALEKGVELDTMIPILKQYFDDDQLLLLLFNSNNWYRLLAIFHQFQLSDKLKNDYDLARRMTCTHLKFASIFKTAPFIKELIMEALRKGKSYFDLESCFKDDLDLFAYTYKKIVGNSQRYYMNINRESLPELLSRGVYIQHDEIEKKFTDMEFVLKHCSKMVI